VLTVLVRRFGARGLAAAALIAAALAAPFAGIGRLALRGLGTYSSEWVMNASVFGVARAWMEPIAADGLLAARILVAGILVIGLVWLAWRPERSDQDVIEKAGAAVGLLFVLSPVGNPWYVGWVLPFAALLGRVSWVVLSGTMVAYYSFFMTRGWTRGPIGPGGPVVDLRVIEYAPFFLVLAAERWRAIVNGSRWIASRIGARALF
jgi:hypothetical protein